MPTPSADDLAACRALLKAGSQSFHAASLMLPRRVRDPATALYAFCRLADDAVDGARGGPGAAAAAVDALGRRLDAVYAGRPRAHPVDRAFAAVVEAHAIPRAIPDALLEGFAWDAAGRTYATMADLEAYAVRVAGTVGLMMALVMDRRDPDVLARAVDLGVAMQLTNIARDVGEDARAGRLYLPLDWLAEAAIRPHAFLAAPAATVGLEGVVLRLLARADRHYARGAGGIAALPAACRPAIHAARLIYGAIGAERRAGGTAHLLDRTVVSGRRKAALAAAAVGASLGPARPRRDPAPEAARPLIRAVAAHAPPARAAGAERLIEILTALEARRTAALDAGR